jgi:thioredoxin-related protein
MLNSFFHHRVLLAAGCLGLVGGAVGQETPVPPVKVQPLTRDSTPIAAPGTLDETVEDPSATLRDLTAAAATLKNVPSALPPGVPPLGLPSDGEAAPVFPSLPDLPMDGGSGFFPTTEALPVTPTEGPEAVADPERVPPEPLSPPVDPALTPPESPRPSAAVTWLRSPRQARELALDRGHCHLMVMTGGTQDVRSQVLNREVLSLPEFNQMAKGTLVLSSLSYRQGSGGVQTPEQVAMDDAKEHCKKMLKVKGFPTVILFGADGREINRWVGYYIDKQGHGLPAAYLKKLKDAIAAETELVKSRTAKREALKAAGFRTWRGAEGGQLFAKLTQADAATALFQDENGKAVHVDIRQLAITDREVIRRKRTLK